MDAPSIKVDNDPESNNNALVEQFKQAVLVRSDHIHNGYFDTPKSNIVRGVDFNIAMGTNAVSHGELLDKIVSSYSNVGFQATNFGRAVEVVNKMISWKPDVQMIQDENENGGTKCTIFLGYTSNLVSSGLRENIRFLAQHSLIDVIVSTAGGVEEDLIKCLAPTYLGDFRMDGAALRKNGLNRIGNLLVPNDNYCRFEEWLLPILDTMLNEQNSENIMWSPSKIIARLGKEIDNEDSICYWAWKNNIPIYCPAITDGSLGDMLFFHSIKSPGLVIDIMDDIRGVNKSAMRAKCTGSIILGGGLVKHHISNANLMRNGADFAVYINTAQEFDGSDAGASPDEAVSW
eukprot:CAMPEP_0182443024 /NCGR_PEP_ID=MMETSP1172-20130603/1871_1 /TAXON_ID=708627 /ORGANISM="Timspurckia oligopyrenoides, Strain CCMP3278" /LENGTH=345 /DNA_ID=CAMNT_0024638173 /DNA_START=139 /DNA_END=1173 /DNA_ORIENTATION=-